MNRYIPRPDLEEINAPAGNPLRDLVYLGIGFLIVVAVAYAAFGLIGEWSLQRIGPETEMKIFGKFTFVSSGLREKPKLTALLDRMRMQGTPSYAEANSGVGVGAGAGVNSIAGMAADGLKIRVSCVKEPNAFAVPGGHIIITEGLLNMVSTENALAFVIAHEIGHFVNRDHLRGLGRQLGMMLAGSLIGLGDGSGAVGKQLMGNITRRTFSRQQEADADAYAIEVMLKTYGHLDGAEEFFVKLQTEEEKRLNSLSSMLSTHPATEKRIEMIRERQRRIGSHGAVLPFQLDTPCAH